MNRSLYVSADLDNIEMKRKMVKILNKVTSGKMMSYHDYCCINSYNGWLKHCDSIRLKRKYIEDLIKVIKRAKNRRKNCQMMDSKTSELVVGNVRYIEEYRVGPKF